MSSFSALFTIFLGLLSSMAGHAVEIRVATYNIRLGLETEGTLGRDAAESVMARISPDILALQELYDADRFGSPSNLEDLAAKLGYDHIFVPNGAIDPQSRVILLSKFPFLKTWSINSPPGSNDVTRAAAAALIDVPGSESDPLIITAHHKCCLEEDDSFRRAVEMQRINDFLDQENVDARDPIFVLGDFNLIGGSFTYHALPNGLPASYRLGDDIPFPVAYSPNPASYFPSFGLVNPGYRQQNGTSGATHSSGSVLDHILISGPIAERRPRTEIYNSSQEARFPGLRKSGDPLNASASSDASDHLLVFGDYELSGGEALQLQVSQASLSETSPSITLSVTLPQAPANGQSITVNLSSSDSSEIIPADSSLTFSPGQTIATTRLLPQIDHLLDGSQEALIRASASGYNGAEIAVTVSDSDTPRYRLSGLGTPWVMDLEGFQGEETPAGWTASDPAWRGVDDGTLESRGPRSYGGSSLGSLSGETNRFTARFDNLTGETIRSLSISYQAQQWRSFQNGSPDEWQVTIIVDGKRTPLPGLHFKADTSGVTGPIIPALTKDLAAEITGLNVAPDTTFELEFLAVPGSPGELKSEAVFINEIHYDNTGTDSGEFVEVVVGPGYLGLLQDIELVLYNGNGGRPYGSVRNLGQFMPGAESESSHRFFYSEIEGIQNGAPDGMALIVDGEVRQFISYEGSFTATSGPALGLSSTNIGVSQGSGTPIGQNSLGLTGDGAEAIDFTWAVLAGNYSQGQLNLGQKFLAASQPQGMALDQLTLIPFSTATPPVAEGISAIDFIAPETIRLSIPTALDKRYHLESSGNLLDWISEGSREGDGSLWRPEFPSRGGQYFRIQISPISQ